MIKTVGKGHVHPAFETGDNADEWASPKLSIEVLAQQIPTNIPNTKERRMEEDMIPPNQRPAGLRKD